MKKDKEIIDIDSNCVTDFSNFTGEYSNKIDYMVNNSETTFKPLKKVKFFSKGLNNVEKGFLDIQEAMKKYANVLNGYFNDLNEMEKQLIEVVEGIQIPNDFRLNNSFSVSNRSAINLDKNDGKAVNVASDTSAVNEVSVGEHLIKEEINDISKVDVKESQYDDSSIVNRVNIENLNNKQLDNNQLDDSILTTEKKYLEKMNTDDLSDFDKINSDELIRNHNNQINIEDLINEMKAQNIEEQGDNYEDK